MILDDLIKKIAKFFDNDKNIESKSINNNKNEISGAKSNKTTNSNNKLFNIVVLVLVGILLVILSNSFNQNSAVPTYAQGEKNEIEVTKDDTNLNADLQTYEDRLSNKLKSILENIDGVGRTEVMIYFEGGEEYIPAININDSTSITDETDNNGGKRKINQNNSGRSIVMLNEGSATQPFITKTYEPEITGICIVAEGANEKLTKLRIEQAVMTLFDISEEKVNVYPMKK